MTRNKKREGASLLAKGVALVDTSNRTRAVKEKSAMALASKDIKFTVLMKAKEKKKIFPKLKQKHAPRRVPVIAHSVKLYYALKDNIDRLPGVYICSEGLDKGLLKHYLKNFLKEKYDDKKIWILSSLKEMFGKKNIADRTAHAVAKKGKSPSLELKEIHFEKLRLI